MSTKQEYILFWVEQALDDWSAVDTLFKGKKYLQSLFFANLVIEKLCKALWIKHNKENYPPRTHNLILLITSTPISLSVDQSEFLLNLNRFQFEGRYPDYLSKMHKICDKTFTSSMLNSTNTLRLWLLENLR